MLVLKRGVAWGTEKAFQRENVFITFIRTGTLCITACLMDSSPEKYIQEKKKKFFIIETVRDKVTRKRAPSLNPERNKLLNDPIFQLNYAEINKKEG